jgi:arabinofuranosyltransferase
MVFTRTVRPLLPIALFGTVTLVALLGTWFFYGVTIDDAYISARYAKNLVEGNGLAFNPGVRVEGYSNPTWVFVTGALAAIWGIESLPQIGRVCGVMSTLGAMALSASTLRRLSCGWLSIGAALLLLVALPQTAFWSVAGLETTLYGLLLLLGAVSAGGVGWLSGAATGLGALTRPEGAAFLLSYLLGRVDPKFAFGPNLRRALAFVFAFAAVFMPYLAFRLGYFESLVPNTYLVKAGGAYKLAQGIWYVRGHMTPGGYALIVLALPAIALAPRSPIVRCLALGMLTELVFTVWAGGDWMPQGRFLVPVFFLATPLAGITLNRLFKWLEVVPISASSAVVLILAVLLGLQAREFQKGYDTFYWRIAHGLDSRIALGKWLRANAPGKLTIAYGDMGALPFFSDKSFVDFHGLVDRDIATIRHQVKDRSMYLPLIDADVLRRAPDMIIYVSEDNPTAATWKMSEYGTPVLQQGLAEHYVLQGFLSAYPARVAKEYPNGRHLVIYLRRGKAIPGLSAFLACSNARLPSNQSAACVLSGG